MKNLYGGIYKNKRVLITGHTGFKGTWLSYWLEKMGAEVIGYSVNEVSSPSHHKILEGDHVSVYKNILDTKSLLQTFKKYKPEIIFHLAAQSLVRESYRNPVLTYETNVTGTLNVFEAARISGSVKAIVNVTTDKVYENHETSKAYKEHDRLGGFDLYSSSKACSEILSHSYRRAFLQNGKILLATARAGNVIGGGDWAQDRLIPDLVKAASKKRKSVIRYPASIRPWQHVLEPLSGYLLLGKNLLEGKREFASEYNFGPPVSQCLSVKEVIEMMQKEWNAIDYEITGNQNDFHEAGILKLNCQKAKRELKWEPVFGKRETIGKTAQWYKAYYLEKIIRTEDDLHSYVQRAMAKKLIWA